MNAISKKIPRGFSRDRNILTNPNERVYVNEHGMQLNLFFCKNDNRVVQERQILDKNKNGFGWFIAFPIFSYHRPEIRFYLIKNSKIKDEIIIGYIDQPDQSNPFNEQK